MRRATVSRKTNETDLTVTVVLDGTGKSDVATGIGFLDHMLDQIARHSLIDMQVKASIGEQKIPSTPAPASSATSGSLSKECARFFTSKLPALRSATKT